jgi:hypothetical protein
MFSPRNVFVATLLLFGTMIGWGSWVPIRIMSKTEAPEFVILYMLSQWVTSLCLSLTFGMLTGIGNVFNEDTFVGSLVHSPGSWERIIYVIIGGFLNANGDFLCAAACAKLPASIVSPIASGSCLVQGTLFTFFRRVWRKCICTCWRSFICSPGNSLTDTFRCVCLHRFLRHPRSHILITI